MRVSLPFKGVFHFEADTQYEIASTFIRIQEFFESPYPEIKGKLFTLDEYMDIYAKQNPCGNENEFTYFTDWSGFNIPGHVAIEFFEKFRYDLRGKEMFLLDNIISQLTHMDKKFYIIGTYDKEDLRHEQAHALFYLNDEYRSIVIEYLYSLPDDIYNDWVDEILNMGYDNHVVDDEIHAYMIDEKNKTLNELFDKYKDMQ